MSHILRDKFCGATTVGERGQIVIPAEARKEYGLGIGDKVMVFMSHHGTGLIVIKADQVTRMLSQTIDQLGKIVQESEKPENEKREDGKFQVKRGRDESPRKGSISNRASDELSESGR